MTGMKVVEILFVGILALLVLSVGIAYYVQITPPNDDAVVHEGGVEAVITPTVPPPAPPRDSLVPADALSDVHPVCFSSLGFQDIAVIDVGDCNRQNAQYPIRTEDGYRSAQAYIENEYIDTDSDARFSGYIQYKVVGQAESEVYILVYENTGGSGQFSTLMVMERTGNTLTIIDRVAAGDRCNGGVVGSSYNRDGLTYAINMTPYDLLVLTASTTLQPYDDLESSAASCFGHAHYRYDPTRDTSTLESVSFIGEEVLDRFAPDWETRYPYQVCYNDHYQEHINKKSPADMFLTLDQLRSFNDTFLRKCVGG
jgi:hypothetical protein